jgi:hypothetical protein
MYYEGKGTPRDFAEAYAWFQKAAESKSRPLANDARLCSPRCVTMAKVSREGGLAMARDLFAVGVRSSAVRHDRRDGGVTHGLSAAPVRYIDLHV